MQRKEEISMRIIHLSYTDCWGDHLTASTKMRDSKTLASQGESATGMNQIRAVGSKGCFYNVCGAVGAGRQAAPQLRWEAGLQARGSFVLLLV